MLYTQQATDNKKPAEAGFLLIMNLTQAQIVVFA